MDKRTETLLVIVLGCLGIFLWKGHVLLLEIGFGLGVAGLLIPAVRDGVHWGWMKLSEGLGWVSGKVLLTVVFFFVLTPLAFLARRFGKIGKKGQGGSGSYFTLRDHSYGKDDLVNPW